MSETATPVGLLGDTSSRDYSHKLQLFNAFASAELREAIASLKLKSGMRVLDAGCGTGEALPWLQAAVGDSGLAVGFDLAAAHVAASRARTRPGIALVQGDLTRPCFLPRRFDLVWSANTLNHLRDPIAGIRMLAATLRPGGRLAVGQSSLLHDMFFAWDARLERVVTDAVRRYYRERYGLQEQQLTAVRALIGWMRGAPLENVAVRTFVIERISPVDRSTECYLLEGIFRGTWGERLRPYLAAADYRELAQLCDPGSPSFALRRADFHFLQTFTIAVGTRSEATP